MKEVTRKALGFKIPVQFYDSEAEFDTAAGRKGACLDEGNENLYLRSGTAQEAREVIADVLAKATNIPRKTKPALDDKNQPILKDGNPVTVIDEAEDAYVKRVLASTGKTVEDFQDAVTKAAKEAGFKVNAAKVVRTAASKPLNPAYKATAEKLIAAPAKLAAFGKEVKSLLKKDLTAGMDAVAIGWLVQEVVDFKSNAQLEAAKKARADALAGFGV